MRIGVIGYGYWGPNIVRNFHSQDNCEVVLVADRNPQAEGRLKKMFPSIAIHHRRKRNSDLAESRRRGGGYSGLDAL